MKYLGILFSMIMFNVFLFSSLHGQSLFAPIGAKWNFTSDDEILLSTSLKDTILQGQACRMIKTDTYDKRDNELVRHDSLFVFEKNDSVYYFNKNYNDFLLLYDFTASQGDTLGFVAPVSHTEEKDSFFIVIDSTAVETHHDNPLTYFYVNGIDQEGWHFAHFGGILVEQIGSVHTPFLPETGFRVAISFPILVCYQDEKNGLFTFPEFSTYGCSFDIIDATNDLIDGSTKVVIFPNPANNLLNIRLDDSQTFLSPVSYELLNLHGTSMLRGQTYEKEWNLNVSDLPSGMYLMKLTDAMRSRHHKKILIQ